jgi:hypothetical protein
MMPSGEESLESTLLYNHSNGDPRVSHSGILPPSQTIDFPLLRQCRRDEGAWSQAGPQLFLRGCSAEAWLRPPLVVLNPEHDLLHKCQGTFPLAATYNHSCRPNSIAMYDEEP